MEMQRVRQQEEEKKLEGSSGMSRKEEDIECGSSAVPGLTGPAEGTHGCTATEGKAESLLLAAKGHPPMWRSEMSEVRSDDCEGRELRTEEARTEDGRACGYACGCACGLQRPQQRRAHKEKRGHPGEDG